MKLSDCDCSGGRDCDEAVCVLGLNNQHPSEVMEGRKGGCEGPASEFQSIYVCVEGGWWGGWGNGTLPPGTLHSVKLHG